VEPEIRFITEMGTKKKLKGKPDPKNTYVPRDQLPKKDVEINETMSQEEIFAAMGLPVGFASTKNKHVDDPSCNVSGARVKAKRGGDKRQGGFKRKGGKGGGRRGGRGRRY